MTELIAEEWEYQKSFIVDILLFFFFVVNETIIAKVIASLSIDEGHDIIHLITSILILSIAAVRLYKLLFKKKNSNKNKEDEKGNL